MWLVMSLFIGVAARAEAADDAWFTNSLGMVFKTLTGSTVHCSIWETRVGDFAAFVEATHYEPEEEMPLSTAADRTRRTWRSPGFVQGTNHPVVEVSWMDAQAFCRWLTQHERLRGIIRTNQEYRLPTDAEWTRAAGAGRYPWLRWESDGGGADQAQNTRDPDLAFFPPAHKAGNYAGEEMNQVAALSEFKVLRHFEDGHVHTAPVGSMKPNLQGLFDMGGNAWEWCEDWFRAEMNTSELAAKLPFANQDGQGRTYRVIRGASWIDSNPAVLRTDCHCYEFPDHRNSSIGFRVVLAVKADAKEPTKIPASQSDAR